MNPLVHVLQSGDEVRIYDHGKSIYQLHLIPPIPSDKQLVSVDGQWKLISTEIPLPVNPE